ncbi:hypothetical protein [Ekhidna sp.]|uniref:hypothetical protein n=1 Tax=Ekhidna sp. TaxID=2608089 RepID=UPI003BABCA39
MIVYSTHQKIDAIRKILPEGFVFVLDTTDRSFIYKSKNDYKSEELVFSIDKFFGIDNLTKNKDFYTHEIENSIVKLLKMAKNTFLGVCVDKETYNENQVIKTDQYFNRIIDKTPTPLVTS